MTHFQGSRILLKISSYRSEIKDIKLNRVIHLGSNGKHVCLPVHLLSTGTFKELDTYIYLNEVHASLVIAHRALCTPTSYRRIVTRAVELRIRRTEKNICVHNFWSLLQNNAKAHELHLDFGLTRPEHIVNISYFIQLNKFVLTFCKT